ncbi:nuclear GTPase SLIP-GC-like isoform X2 [Onychostoma macrolepis]|uniref:nuclear GTPase SLIP-GC-like isoform X2 n=1 Tax=Onychostoma macrolepis TaxID=369639 RepID=UPI00272B8A66|nr:nuclear GTPase SLIP-GC-like isoform X2 [Onychostoma macrolepis]
MRATASEITCTESPLTADMAIVVQTQKIMADVNIKIQTVKNIDQPMTSLKTYIVDVISKMDQIDKDNRRKATIGIFGKSGNGKSSLINAILGEEDLLPPGSLGACTAVVTQVEANLDDSNYIAEIELYSKEEWDKMLQVLFRVLSDDSEDRDDEMFESAKENITAVYGENADKKKLEELKKDEKFSEISNFLSNPEKIISKRERSDFANEVACFIQYSVSSPGGWYWPLVKSVKIKIPNCDELLKHIVLLDLPGIGDCNKTRENLWKSKLRECSSVWIVSDIERAITDKDPWGILKHCIQDLGPGGECKNISFICTKTDNINPGAYMRSSRLTKDEIGNKDQTAACILHRNKTSKELVKKKIESLNPGTKKLMEKFSTEVFTVSSKAFFKQNSNLEPTETEIPKLQEVLKSINRRINQEMTRGYVSDAKGVLSLIQIFSPNTNEEMVETKARVHDKLANNLKNALTELDCQFVKMYENLDKCLSEGVKKSVRLCVATAQKELIEPDNIDNRGFHKTLKALCKNKGHYWSKNWCMILDLNECLATHMQESINEEFNQIFPVNAKTEKSLQKHLDKMSIIQSDDIYCRSSMLYHIHNFIKTRENKLKASLGRKVIDRKKKIYSSISTTIQEKMGTGYEKAAKIKGKNTLKKMQKILSDTIESLKDDMFSEVKTMVLEEFDNLKLEIKNDFELEMKRSMEPFHLHTGKTTLLDVSREIEEIERVAK